MSDDAEIDVEELRAELDQIKDAMGLEERYSGATHLWLLFGVLVVVASALSQYVVLERLPRWLFGLIWVVVLGGGYVGWMLWTNESLERQGVGGKPNILFQFVVIYLAAFPILTVVGAYMPEQAYLPGTAMVLGIVLILLGVAYAVMGSSLGAYYIRFRDRVVFYVGAVLMVALGTAIPLVDSLERWGYAAFGSLYFVYAIGAYVYLSRTGADRSGPSSAGTG